MVTILNEKGIPTPLAHAMMRTPRSRMGALTDSEINALVSNSKLVAKYNQVINTESAYEILMAKLEEAAANSPVDTKKIAKEEESTLGKVTGSSVVKSMMRTAGNTIVRSLLGYLVLGGRSRKSTKRWF